MEIHCPNLHAPLCVPIWISHNSCPFGLADFVRYGMAAGVNQLAVTIVQIIMNNTLGYYEELSQYGRDIPLACVGIISKVNVVFNSIIFGLSQSTQPIIGYNYGAQNYSRLKDTFHKVACNSVPTHLGD